MTTGKIPQSVSHVADLLSPLGEVRARRFFGGTGLILDGVQFAFAMKGELYFRVDETSRQAYADRGSEPFRYRTTGRTVEVASYHCVPVEIVENPANLLAWAEGAHAIARAAGKTSRRSA